MGKASTYFPDQPILISLSKQGEKRILISVEVNGKLRMASIGKEEFFSALRDAGIDFFSKLSVLVPITGSAYEAAVGRLKSV